MSKITHILTSSGSKYIFITHHEILTSCLLCIQCENFGFDKIVYFNLNRKETIVRGVSIICRTISLFDVFIST